MRRLLIFAFTTLAACSTETLDPQPLDIVVEATRITAAPGDSVGFLVTARGSQLIGIITAYGDGEQDQFATGGARTARVTFRHAFSARGTYQVQATVTDAVAGEKNASVAVLIN